MHIYDADDGPTITIELPQKEVEKLLDVLWYHVTPAMGLDQLIHDEIRAQYVVQHGDSVIQ